MLLLAIEMCTSENGEQEDVIGSDEAHGLINENFPDLHLKGSTYQHKKQKWNILSPGNASKFLFISLYNVKVCSLVTKFTQIFRLLILDCIATNGGVHTQPIYSIIFCNTEICSNLQVQ